jgi:GntR family transcriptional regulator/MocR family aminotransferase
MVGTDHDTLSLPFEDEHAASAERAAGIDWALLFRDFAPSERSLQVQIRQMVVAAIEERRLVPGARMPSSRELAASLGVARNTVVLAYRQLLDEGFLSSRERSGYFVAESTSSRPLLGPKEEGTDHDRDAYWRARLTFRPSRQRNIVKRPDWLRYPYPFLYGQFDPSLFPTNDWRECARAALSVLEIQNWARDLIDGDDPELIDQLRIHVLPRAGIFASPDEIIVTVGAQQALFMLAQLFFGKRGRIGIENPGYPDARNIFGMMGAEVVPLAIDEAGLVPSEAAAACDYLYVTTAHQCPTTVTMPASRRQALLDLARRSDAVIIEDGYDAELAPGSGPASLKSLDPDGRVIHIGSFSKILAPGLRLGYVIAPAALARELRALRRLMLRHPPSNNQRAAALFLGLGHYKSHLRRVTQALGERARLLDRALQRHVPQFRRLRGGGASSYWLEGPLGFDCNHLAEEAEKHGVLIEPGDIFFAGDNPPRNFLRLGFASISRERIDSGIAALAKAVEAVEGGDLFPREA